MEEKDYEIREKQDSDLIVQKNKAIKKELNRLKKLFKDLPENKKKISEKLIDNAAFMSVSLEELKKDIILYGVKETYVNGKEQFGFKESIESKTYNITIKNYMAIIKQLNEMLPEDKQINEDDEFDKFNDLK